MALTLSQPLRKIFWVRNLSLCTQFFFILLTTSLLDDSLLSVKTISLLVSSFFFNFLTYIRLNLGKQAEKNEIFFHLLVDALILTLLLYFNGGATHPFTAFYLIPLTLSAAYLPIHLTKALSLCTLFFYSGLFIFYENNQHSMHHPDFMTLHLFGMALSFLMSVAVIFYFIGEIKKRDAALLNAQEKELKDQHLLALATMATGAAHALGTPLTTIKMLSKELALSTHLPQEDKKDLQMILQEVERCKNMISTLLNQAKQPRLTTYSARPTSTVLQDLKHQWQNIHYSKPPIMNITFSHDLSHALIYSDETTEQAMLNLFNNAQEAGAQHLEISTIEEDAQVTLIFIDDGRGFTDTNHQNLEQYTQAFYSTKSEPSHGLGLFLAKTTFERQGGTLLLKHKPKTKGAEIHVSLPKIK